MLVGIVGVVKGAQQPDPAPAIGMAIGFAFGMVIGNIPGWLISYFLARAFGLGRTYAAFGLFGGLCGLVLLIAFPGGIDGQKWQMAMKADADAKAAKQAVAGGGGAGLPMPQGGPPPGVVNVPAGGAPGVPIPPMGGSLALAAANGQFDSRVLRETNVGDIKISVASIGMIGSTAPATEMHIFHPTSNALADADGSRPCVHDSPGRLEPFDRYVAWLGRL